MRNFRSNPIIKRLILSYTLYFKKPAANHWKHNKFFQYTITALYVGKHPDLSTWGENNPQRVDKSGCFSTQRAVIVLLYFCQCFIGYLPCGGKLGCLTGNNRVVSRQRKCLPMFYRLSPLWGKIGLFGREQ
jgi:hypothetical protein